MSSSTHCLNLSTTKNVKIPLKQRSFISLYVYVSPPSLLQSRWGRPPSLNCQSRGIRKRIRALFTLMLSRQVRLHCPLSHRPWAHGIILSPASLVKFLYILLRWELGSELTCPLTGNNLSKTCTDRNHLKIRSYFGCSLWTCDFSQQQPAADLNFYWQGHNWSPTLCNLGFLW